MLFLGTVQKLELQSRSFSLRRAKTSLHEHCRFTIYCKPRNFRWRFIFSNFSMTYEVPKEKPLAKVLCKQPAAMSRNMVSSYTTLYAPGGFKSAYLTILKRSSEPYCQYCKRILLLLFAAPSHIEESISAFAKECAAVSVSVSSTLGSGCQQFLVLVTRLLYTLAVLSTIA